MKIVEVRHPLVQHKIGLMRNAALSTKDFRELANELGTLLAYEATADLETEPHTLPGWSGPVSVQLGEFPARTGCQPGRSPARGLRISVHRRSPTQQSNPRPVGSGVQPSRAR